MQADYRPSGEKEANLGEKKVLELWHIGRIGAEFIVREEIPVDENA